jgi:transcriptional regulator with XRE-family HTH domain
MKTATPEIRLDTPVEIQVAYAESGLTLDELAMRAKLDGVRSTILRKISGERRITGSELLKLAKLFGFTVAWDRRNSFTLTKAA